MFEKPVHLCIDSTVMLLVVLSLGRGRVEVMKSTVVGLPRVGLTSPLLHTCEP